MGSKNQFQSYFAMQGGYNQKDPPISMRPGFAIGASNYEVAPRGGYRRLDGYERYDGFNRPSSATYWIVNFDAGDTAMSAGDLVGDSGSPTIQGELLIDAVLESGSYAGSDAAGYIVVMAVNGKTTPASFSNNDALYVGSSQVCTVNGAVSQRGASTDALDSTYYQDAVTTTRADISAVPGSGSVLGVHVFDGDVYAIRKNSGGTVDVLHKATTTGWTEVGLGKTIAFTSGGTTQVAIGDVLDGAISGAQGTVAHIHRTSGTWAGGDAAGTFTLHTVTGTFQSEDLDINGGASNVATVAGDATAQTLAAGGRYEFINSNFAGSGGTSDLGVKMYGVGGVDKAFYYDGTSFVKITTGMPTDTPKHIIEHKSHLFLSFPNGSLQFSPIGDPFPEAGWSVVLGAGEIATRDEITGLQDLPGDVLGVFNRNSIYILYGSSSDDWSLSQHSDVNGAIEWSLQRLGTAVFCDDRGLSALQQTDAYGNFEDGTFSSLVQKYVNTNKTQIVASCIVRDKNQYCLFYTDGTGLYATFQEQKLSGIMPISFDDAVTCITSQEDGSGNEVIYFGSTDGFVYQLNKGTSFDGGDIECFIRTAFDHNGTPELRKRYRKVKFEVEATSAVTLKITPSFNYVSDDEAESAEETSSINQGAGGFWNVDDWDEFYWTSGGTATPHIKIDGTGTNISFNIYSLATWEEPHIIYGGTITYSQRRLTR